MARFRLNLIMIVLMVTLVVVQYRLWFENGGLRDMSRLKLTLGKQEELGYKLKKRNEEMAEQVGHLKTNEDATETRARNELGMIKKGETFYQFVQ